jgi:phage tail sheath gpL-like
MSTTVIRITHSKAAAALAGGRLSQETGNARELCIALAALFERIAAGHEPATVELSLGATEGAAATGTLTLSSAAGAVGATIAGTLVTATASGGDTNSAALVAAAINAHATVGKLVGATSALGVVTLRSRSKSAAGGQITVVASGTGVTAGGLTGGKLTGGAGDDLTPVSYTRS